MPDQAIPYDTPFDHTITEAAQAMAALAEQRRRPVVTEFNGITVVAGPGATVASVVAAYRADWAGRSEATRPQREAAEAERITRGNARMSELMHELASLDVTDQGQTLDWLVKLHDTWEVGINVPRNDIAQRIGSGGYLPNPQPGAAPQDKHGFGRWLIEQVLNWLIDPHGFMPEGFPNYVEYWRTLS